MVKLNVSGMWRITQLDLKDKIDCNNRLLVERRDSRKSKDAYSLTTWRAEIKQKWEALLNFKHILHFMVVNCEPWNEAFESYKNIREEKNGIFVKIKRGEYDVDISNFYVSCLRYNLLFKILCTTLLTKHVMFTAGGTSFSGVKGG